MKGTSQPRTILAFSGRGRQHNRTSLIGTASSSFPAFAIVAAIHGLTSLEFPDKSFYLLGGRTEATEAIAAFAALCLWPAWFPVMAYGYAVMCVVTIALRIGWGWQRFG